MEANAKGGKLEFNAEPKINPQHLISLIQKQPQRFRIDGPTKLRFSFPAHEVRERIVLSDNLIKEIGQLE